eukprot:EG_transcript_17443
MSYAGGNNDEWFQASSSSFPGASHTINVPAFAPTPSPFETPADRVANGGAASGNLLLGLKNQVREHAMSYVAQEAMNLTKSRAAGMSRLFSVDWLVDWLRPYFFVDAPLVLQRMRASFMPKCLDFAIHEPDLYGPAMIACTASLVIRLCMKSSGVSPATSNSAIGTALAVCFGYWLGATAVLFLASYASDTRLTLPSMLCLVGYAMTCYLLVVPGAYLGAALFYLLLLAAGGASAVALALTIRQATPDIKRGAPTATICAALHVVYLLYVKWWYLG